MKVAASNSADDGDGTGDRALLPRAAASDFKIKTHGVHFKMTRGARRALNAQPDAPATCRLHSAEIVLIFSARSASASRSNAEKSGPGRPRAHRAMINDRS